MGQAVALIGVARRSEQARGDFLCSARTASAARRPARESGTRHLVPGLPGVEFDPGPPARLVVAAHSVRIRRIRDVLTRQVLPPQNLSTGLFGNLADQRGRDRFAGPDRPAGKRPARTVWLVLPA